MDKAKDMAKKAQGSSSSGTNDKTTTGGSSSENTYISKGVDMATDKGQSYHCIATGMIY